MNKKVLVFALILLVLLPAVVLASNDIATAQEQNQDSFSKTDNNTEKKPATDFSWQLIFTGIIAVVAVIGILFSIGLSMRATAAARKAAQGELVMQISNTYGSPKMLEAMMRLVWWVEQKEEDPREDWLKTFRERRKNCDRYSEIAQVDKDRRKFSHYYGAFNILEKYGLLDKEIVKDLRSGKQVFYEMIVGPLTDQIKIKVTEEWPKLTVNYQEDYLAKQKLRDIEQKKINDQKKK